MTSSSAVDRPPSLNAERPDDTRPSLKSGTCSNPRSRIKTPSSYQRSHGNQRLQDAGLLPDTSLTRGVYRNMISLTSGCLRCRCRLRSAICATRIAESFPLSFTSDSHIPSIVMSGVATDLDEFPSRFAKISRPLSRATRLPQKSKSCDENPVGGRLVVLRRK